MEGWKNDDLQICPPGLQSLWCAPLILKTGRKLRKDLGTDGMPPTHWYQEAQEVRQ